jgi:predicted nucleotidyltransferase
LNIIKTVCKDPFFKDFRLVGGTALSLHLGHRKSVDIRLADLPDIAALKMEAIINRKEEKDFRDIHALLQKFKLADLLVFFSERYPHFSPRLVRVC